MIFTWSSTDLCIIFRQWHIRGPWSLFLSLLAIVFLTAGYEAVRQITRRYEVGRAQRLQAFSATVSTGGKHLFSSISHSTRNMLYAFWIIGMAFASVLLPI